MRIVHLAITAIMLFSGIAIGCDKCSDTGIVETYEVSDKAYAIEAAARIKATQMNEEEDSILTARADAQMAAGGSASIISKKPVWVAYLRSDGNFGIRRMTPTSSKYCDCAAGVAAKKKDDEAAQAAAKKCPRCQGRGKILFREIRVGGFKDSEEVEWEDRPNFMWRKADCPKCKGTGRADGAKPSDSAAGSKQVGNNSASPSAEQQRKENEERSAADATGLLERKKDIEKRVTIWTNRLHAAQGQKQQGQRALADARRELNGTIGGAASGSAIIFDNSQAVATAQATIVAGEKDEKEAASKVDQAQAELRDIVKQIEKLPASATQTPAKGSANDGSSAPKARARDAKWLMGMANQCITNGDWDSAAKYYKRVVDEYPDAPEAKDASQLLKDK